MESKHLIYLATVLDKGSITAAADYLNVAQPTMTRAMATLEMQVGAELFTRSRFGVRSTTVGESLAREGRVIQQLLKNAEERASFYKYGITKELRIAAGPLLCTSLAPTILDQFAVSFPDIALTVTCLNPASALEGLQNDEFDIVLAPLNPDQTINSVHRELIVPDHLGIFCSQSHPIALAANQDKAFEDFRNVEWLGLGMASPYEKQAYDMLRSLGIKATQTKIIFKNDAVMLIKMLRTGRYLATLPRFPISVMEEANELVELPVPTNRLANRDLYLWCKTEMKDQEIFQTLLNITQNVCAGHQSSQLT
ncbi:LysR family transcriptional regulator [Marinomonas balearica]|uniref:DNA-binding transcriptional LysR family regulator n=1 Tax=Marinomonas balearica TaxID=491947 RepID=A0A4R6M3Q7_9GAMM|nr:LysR family transcriptional regulator [Marinomonas balearica]TDO95824.1 DNA-binding transcriptional LysR family regulator [Marinomonas balearica]